MLVQRYVMLVIVIQKDLTVNSEPSHFDGKI